ncbi:hypothetical protein QBK95_05555 [Aquimarina sp. 2201CG14-23]|nr:hypothetical protein [Aquimarina sp. 2201CG14-23]
MEIFEYLTGKGGLLILGLIAVIALLYKKYQNWRYFKNMEKRRKNKN